MVYRLQQTPGQGGEICIGKLSLYRGTCVQIEKQNVNALLGGQKLLAAQGTKGETS